MSTWLPTSRWMVEHKFGPGDCLPTYCLGRVMPLYYSRRFPSNISANKTINSTVPVCDSAKQGRRSGGEARVSNEVNKVHRDN